MAKHNMNEIIAVAAEYRCFEDFDYRKRRQKISFYRKWYHTRAKISVESISLIKMMSVTVISLLKVAPKRTMMSSFGQSVTYLVREKRVLSHPNCLCVIQMSVAKATVFFISVVQLIYDF